MRICRYVFLFVFLLTQPFVLVQAQSYPDNSEGLQQLLTSAVSSAAMGDNSGVVGYVQEMVIPNYQEWFRTTYLPDRSEKWSSLYASGLEKKNQLLEQQLSEIAKAGGSIVVQKLDNNSGQQGSPAWQMFHFASAPIDMYFASWRSSSQEMIGKPIGYFTYIEGKFRWLSLIPGSSEGVFRVGGGVSAPRALVTPDPGYTKEAQKAKLQGKVVLLLIVDSAGNPRDIKVARSLDPVLDEKAVEAVKQWKFSPAMKDGRPVAVQINVEVNFKLY